MKVKLLSPRSGTDGSYGAGEVIDLPDAEAKRYIADGLAEEAPAVVAPMPFKRN
jgi:hypothetical protein